MGVANNSEQIADIRWVEEYEYLKVVNVYDGLVDRTNCMSYDT